MATITGTKLAPTVVKRPQSKYDARGVHLVAANFAAYTGSTDDATITGVGAAITASMRDGKTRTLRAAFCSGAGYDGTQSVYAGACTVSSDALTFNLTNAAGTELTSSAVTTVPVQFYVEYDES